jgi:hypothetical protein
LGSSYYFEGFGYNNGGIMEYKSRIDELDGYSNGSSSFSAILFIKNSLRLGPFVSTGGSYFAKLSFSSSF